MTPRDWALLRQWDAARRCLMLLHPWFGLEQAGILMGTWQSGMRPGWNLVRRDPSAEHRTVYTFISEDGATTTIVPPGDDAEPVHDATRRPPPLEGSRLWSVVCEVGEAIVRHGLVSRVELNRTRGAIEQAARSLREEERMKSLWREAMARFAIALRNSRSGRVLTEDFHRPVFELVEAYLACTVSGMLARELLGVLLSAQCTIPTLGPPGTMPAESRIAAIEHLADTTYRLISKRDTMDAFGRAEATYLAGLYACAEDRIATWAEPSGKHTAKELDRIGKLSLNLDELFANRVAPAFTLSALFTPREILVWIARRAADTARTVAEVAELHQLDPTLRALLESSDWQSMSDDQVNAAFQRASDSAPRFDARTALGRDANPVAPENVKKIATDMVANEHGGRSATSPSD